MQEPYVSIVLVSRNDDRGGGLSRRTEICVTSAIEGLERAGVFSEVIVVEWFPPEGRPFLKDIFPWPRQGRFCSVRVMTAPRDMLKDRGLTDDYSIRDLTPWNAGIRRARGRFILSTVTDVLFSDGMFERIARKDFDPGAVHRIDRCDVDRRVTGCSSRDEQMVFCRTRVIDRHTLNPWKFLMKRDIPVLHDKAPGDFILLSRERWHSLRGFPEHINCGADTLLLYMAHCAGARQVILRPPCRMYHIDHDSRWKKPAYLAARRFLNRLRMPPSVIDVVARVGDMVPSRSCLEKKGVVLFSNGEARTMIREMCAGRRSPVYNDETWGLGRCELPEFKVAGP